MCLRLREDVQVLERRREYLGRTSTKHSKRWLTISEMFQNVCYDNCKMLQQSGLKCLPPGSLFFLVIGDREKLDITNQSKRPITITLAGGKKLRLGPGKTGQVTPKAAKHPAIQKLVEAGTIALAQGGSSAVNRSTGGGAQGPSQRRSSGGGIRQTGDR